MMETLSGYAPPIETLRSDHTMLEEARRAAEGGRTEEAVSAFESVLATLLVREMRRSVTEGIAGDGPGADVYESWFDEQIGRSLAGSDALGLAAMIRTSIDRLADRSASTESAPR